MNKSYKQFSLITLQLIIPLSTMTKAEYKEAYGIDLDDIDIEKVTLLQEDGSKNKYFVDEIKTTESGIDIYAGGKILSIGSSVSVVSNVYSVANAKSIYFHPIRLKFLLNTGDNKLLCSSSIIILNNDPTPFTYATLCKWVFDNNINIIADTPVIDFLQGEFFGSIQNYRKYTDDTRLEVIILKLDNTNLTASLTEAEILSFDDSGVNKIN